MIGSMRVAVVAGVLTAANWTLPISIHAAAPQLAFDVPSVVECFDLTTEAFAAANPDEKLIGATISLSLLVREGTVEQIDELLVVVESPGRRAMVVDFFPRTETVSDIAGPVATTTTHEKKKSIDAGVSTKLPFTLNIGDFGVTPSLDASRSKSDSVSEQFEKLPPRTPLVTSGTTSEGHGVFFKFRASSQLTLEGAREVRCLFAVPRDWRGDHVVVHCEARYRNASMWNTKSLERVAADRSLALYLSGDVESKAAAQALVTAIARRAAVSSSAKGGDPRNLWNELRAGLTGSSPKSTSQARADREVRRALGVLTSFSGHSTVLAKTE